MSRPYSQQSDLSPARIPEADLVQLCRDDAGDAMDDAAVLVFEAARDDADSEIDAFLGERYTVPLDEVPEMVRRISVALTLYHLYARRYPGEVPKLVLDDYRRKRALLRKIADGQPTLGVQPAPGANPERAARLTSHTRVFSRDKLAGF